MRAPLASACALARLLHRTSATWRACMRTVAYLPRAKQPALLGNLAPRWQIGRAAAPRQANPAPAIDPMSFRFQRSHQRGQVFVVHRCGSRTCARSPADIRRASHTGASPGEVNQAPGGGFRQESGKAGSRKSPTSQINCGPPCDCSRRPLESGWPPST